MKRVAKSQYCVVEQNLVFVGGTNNVEHDVGLHLIQDNAVVVQDNVSGLLGRLVDETFLECLLRLQVGIRMGRYACASYSISS